MLQVSEDLFCYILLFAFCAPTPKQQFLSLEKQMDNKYMFKIKKGQIPKNTEDLFMYFGVMTKTPTNLR